MSCGFMLRFEPGTHFSSGRSGSTCASELQAGPWRTDVSHLAHQPARCRGDESHRHHPGTSPHARLKIWHSLLAAKARRSSSGCRRANAGGAIAVFRHRPAAPGLAALGAPDRRVGDGIIGCSAWAGLCGRVRRLGVGCRSVLSGAFGRHVQPPLLGRMRNLWQVKDAEFSPHRLRRRLLARRRYRCCRTSRRRSPG